MLSTSAYFDMTQCNIKSMINTIFDRFTSKFKYRWYLDNEPAWIPMLIASASVISIANASDKLTITQLDTILEGLDRATNEKLKESNFIDWLSKCELLGLTPWQVTSKTPNKILDFDIFQIARSINDLRLYIIGLIHEVKPLKLNSESRCLLDWLEEFVTESKGNIK